MNGHIVALAESEQRARPANLARPRGQRKRTSRTVQPTNAAASARHASAAARWASTKMNSHRPDTTGSDRLWSEHLPLLVGLASAFFVAIRILSAAGFNVETAYGILQSGGTATVLIGATLSSVGVICVAISAICFYRYIEIPWDRLKEMTRQRQLNSIVGIAFGVASLFTAPVGLLVIIVLIVVAYFVLAYGVGPLLNRIQGGPSDEQVRTAIARRDPDVMRQMLAKKERNERSARRWFKLTVIPLAYAILTLPPWMPAQELNIRGAKPVVAYVLSESETNLTILLVVTRHIEYIDISSVISRTVV